MQSVRQHRGSGVGALIAKIIRVRDSGEWLSQLGIHLSFLILQL